MIDLNFQVTSVQPAVGAATPTLAFQIGIAQPSGRPPVSVHSVALHCQIRLEPARRRYSADETHSLYELFAEPHRWGQTMRSMLWTHVEWTVPAFVGRTTVELPVFCTYDFTLTANKFFDALEAGDIPLCFLFRGTVFYAAENGALQAGRIPWEKEAEFRLSLSTWRNLMDLYYPNTAWMPLRKDLFDRLRRYQIDQGLATPQQALERFLDSSRELIA